MGPKIRTERLLVRLPQISDADSISLYAGDLDIARMTTRIPHPYPVPAAEMWVLMIRAGYTAGGNMALTVEHEGEAIGGGGLFKRTADGEWEIGYWIGKPWWGRGLATELGEGLLTFARDELGTGRVIAGHYDDNPASGRVLEKLGFAYTGQSRTEFSMARMGRATCLDMDLNFAAT